MRWGERDSITRKAYAAVREAIERGETPGMDSAGKFASTICKYDAEPWYWAQDAYIKAMWRAAQ
jgi:hypothetical protein